MRYHNKAQNFVEYTLILGIVGVALISMQTYFKRGIQSVIKVTADDLGPQGEPLASKFRDDPGVRALKVEDMKKVELATKAKLYPADPKHTSTTTVTDDVIIENKGAGNIVRTINKKETISDDVSH